MNNFKKFIACIMSVSCLAAATSFTSSADYNGNRAGTYAVTHTSNSNSDCSKYNSNYVKHDQDCTNFVSQCIYAGGMRMYYSIASGVLASEISGVASLRSDEWFYYHKGDTSKDSYSTTWTIVDWHWNKLPNNGLRRYLWSSSKNSYNTNPPKSHR